MVLHSSPPQHQQEQLITHCMKEHKQNGTKLDSAKKKKTWQQKSSRVITIAHYSDRFLKAVYSRTILILKINCKKGIRPLTAAENRTQIIR